MPAAPMSSSVLRPSLSMTLMPMMVNDEVGEADGDGLLVARDLAEAGGGKDVVQVVEDGVDAGELIECADGDGEKERVAVLPAEDGLVRGGVLFGQGGANVGELGFGIWLAHHLEHCEASSMRSLEADQRGLRGMPKSSTRKIERGNGSDAHLPAPLGCAQMQSADEVVGGVGDQDAEDDVELEGADQAAAPLGGRQLCNVDGAEHRGSADAESADEAEDHERRPVPGKRAADGRDDIEDGGDAQGFAAAELLADDSRRQVRR